jgi:hypothetical protein
MNREQMIDALVCIAIDEVRTMDTHQWLGVIRSLFNITFSSMDDAELLEQYKSATEKDNGGSDIGGIPPQV